MIYDISLSIHNNMLVWRGDSQPSIKTTCTLAKDGVGMSEFSLSSHTGTHVDAPSHFVEGGGIDSIDLEKLVGPCRVLDLTDQFRRHPGKPKTHPGSYGDSGQAVRRPESFDGELRTVEPLTAERARMTSRKEIFAQHLDQFNITKGERILFKTGNYKLLKKSEFPDSYISLSIAAAEYLVKKEVVLVGIDFLGIEKEKNPGHPVHKALLSAGIVNVEGLDLENVPEGKYQLICLPLRVAADGSPARAVLVKE